MSALQSRILIGLIGFPSVIYIIFNHVMLFNVIVIICFILAFREFEKIIKVKTGVKFSTKGRFIF